METLGFPGKVKNRKQANASNPSMATNDTENEIMNT